LINDAFEDVVWILVPQIVHGPLCWRDETKLYISTKKKTKKNNKF
jgi:hypothetical protein